MMGDIHTVKYYSVIKKKRTMPFATTWMELEIPILKEVCQRKTNIYHLYGEYKRRLQANIPTKWKQN